MPNHDDTRDKDWPFGRPTRPCDTCHGTGLDRARVSVYTTTRADFGAADDAARAERVVCPTCKGRGRHVV